VVGGAEEPKETALGGSAALAGAGGAPKLNVCPAASAGEAAAEVVVDACPKENVLPSAGLGDSTGFEPNCKLAYVPSTAMDYAPWKAQLLQ
jgi:hypothetical protein